MIPEEFNDCARNIVTITPADDPDRPGQTAWPPSIPIRFIVVDGRIRVVKPTAHIGGGTYSGQDATTYPVHRVYVPVGVLESYVERIVHRALERSHLSAIMTVLPEPLPGTGPRISDDDVNAILDEVRSQYVRQMLGGG